MPTLNSPCYRDSSGVAHLALPHRVRLADGSTRTDASQWFADLAVREATGWSESTLTQADVDRLSPTPEPVVVIDVDGSGHAMTPDEVQAMIATYHARGVT
jgi:hypothetical protein